MLFDDWPDLDAVVSFDVIEGASASASAGSVSARGTAQASVTDAELTATAGDATAFGTVDIPGTASVGGAGATSAAGDVTAAAQGQATVTGAQASTSAASVAATGDENEPEQPATPAGRPMRPQAYAPPFVRVDAVAKVKPVAMRAQFGVVQADGTISAVACVSAASVGASAGGVTARGILNPTDDELMLLLLAA